MALTCSSCMVLGTRRTPRGPTYAQHTLQSIPSRLQSINPIWAAFRWGSVQFVLERRIAMCDICTTFRNPRRGTCTSSCDSDAQHPRVSFKYRSLDNLLSPCEPFRLPGNKGELGVGRKPVTDSPCTCAPLGLRRAGRAPQLPISQTAGSQHARQRMLNS